MIMNQRQQQLSNTNNVSQIGAKISISLAQSYVANQKPSHPLQLNQNMNPNLRFNESQTPLKKENTPSKINSKGKWIQKKNNQLKQSLVILPQIKGGVSDNQLECLQINSISELKYYPNSVKQRSEIDKKPVQSITKPFEQYSIAYKMQVQKKNQTIKNRLHENGYQGNQSNYLPLPSKLQEREFFQNSLNLQIIGSSNQQKLPTLSDQHQKPRKSSYVLASPKISLSKLTQQNNYMNSKQHNIFSQQKNHGFNHSNNGQNLNILTIQNTHINNKSNNNIIKTQKMGSLQFDKLENNPNNVIPSELQNVNKNVKPAPTEIINQNQKVLGEDVQMQDIQKSLIFDDESEDRTIHKRQKNQGGLVKSDNRQVKLNLENNNEASDKQIKQIDIQTKQMSGNGEKNNIIAFIDSQFTRNNDKKQDNGLFIGGQIEDDQSQNVKDIVPNVNLVLSRKTTLNMDLPRSMENSTFLALKKIQRETSQFNSQQDLQEESEDSFAEEERENINENQQQSEETLELKTNIVHINDDDNATISFKQQMQQQVIEKSSNAEILKTLVLQQTKQQSTAITNSTYQSRIESIQLHYSKQESKITVQHNKNNFTINIFSDDTGGGRYDWKINDVMLGVGSQGRVYKAFCLKSVRNFALKMINVDDFESEDVKDVIAEILILKNVRGYSSFLQLFDIFALEKLNSKTIVMVMDYCQCNLFEILNYRKYEKKEWSENELMSIFKSMLDGNLFLKEKNICHRDLKMQNILFTAKEMKYKIGDFSEGKFLLPSQVKKPNQSIPEALSQIEEVEDELMLHSFRGTWKYLSPELSVALGNVQDICEYDPYTSDLYSLGIMFSDMISLEEIKFQTKSNGDRSQNNKIFMINLKAYLTGNIQNNIKPAACELILCLLNEIPKNRKAYQSIVKSYEQQHDISSVVLEEDRIIAVEIENRRENSKIMSQYQKAKKHYIIAEGYEKILKFEKAIEAYEQVLQCNEYQLYQ